MKLWQIYFDIVAQGVFYSFFYAFPRSRLEFDDNYKKYVFSIFSRLFTDMEISHHSEFIKGYNFIENWKLDLGAGDVLKQSMHIVIKFSKTLKLMKMLNLRCRLLKTTA